MTRTVSARVRLDERSMAPGFSVRSLRPSPGLTLDPFLTLDEFRMSEPIFPPHPHAGFSAVTYMLERSEGAFTNRDSLGDCSRIGPGALHWTQAARGMMHEEVPEVPGLVSQGFQIFVNLRERDKLAAPRAFHLDAHAIPTVDEAGARVRVLAGAVGEVRSPLTELLTPVQLLDVRLTPSAEVRLPAPRAHSAFAIVLDGDGLAGGAPIATHEAVGFAGDADELILRGGPSRLTLLVAGGAPIGEPVVAGGPFVMTRRADIDAASARYRRGEMGQLAPSFAR